MVLSKSGSVITDDVDIEMDVIINMCKTDGPVEIERPPQ